MSSALAAPNVHVVFSAECNHALSWQSVGIFHSHKAVNQPGPITRLLACSEEQLQTYRGLDIGPTFVHHNMRFGHPLIDEVGYPSYNKPASVMFWLEQVDVKEEFIALLDTDMQLREPLDPVALGARRGVVVSAEYAYLVGTKGKFVRRFLEAEEVPLAAQCGGFHIFHRDDLRVIAPLWVEFTKRVRAFAKQDMESCAAALPLRLNVTVLTYCDYTYYARYGSESFLNWHITEGVSPLEIETRRHQALWQAEMYGYAFGAARANVSHIVRGDTMLYPGYEPRAGLMPTILHYGSDYTIVNEEGGSLITPTHGRSTYFNKMGHKELDLYACRGHNERTAQGAPCLPTSQAATPCSQPATPCRPARNPVQPACNPVPCRRALLLRRAAAHRDGRGQAALEARPAHHAAPAAAQRRLLRLLPRALRRAARRVPHRARDPRGHRAGTAAHPRPEP